MQNKKKILIAVTKSNWGGAQRYVYDIANNLPKDQFEVVVLLGGSGILKNKLEEILIRTISLSYLNRDINLIDEIRAFFDLLKILRHEKPDIFHINSSKMGGLGSLAGRISGIRKIIFTAHGWPFLENRFFVSKWLIAFFSWLTVIFGDKTIVISKADQNISLQFPLARNKITLIPNGIGKVNFLEKSLARVNLLGEEKAASYGEAFWVAGGTELTANKNLTTAIEGVVKAKEVGLNLIYLIFGEGEEKRKLQSLIEREKATSYIKLLGFKENAAQYFRAFDCFLLTSQKEGLPYSLLEAGLAELSVLASKIGGIPEIIEDKVTGYLLKNTEAKTIAEALLKASEIPLGSSLKLNIEKNFSLSGMVEKTISLYLR